MSENADFKASIGALLEGFMDSANREDDRKFAGLLASPVVEAAIASVAARDPDGFYHAFAFPVRQALDTLLRNALPGSPDGQFLFANSQFVDAQFRRVIEQFEGMSCCADKTRTVMRKLAQSLADGTVIEFDRTGKYTFHLPVKVFTTHDSVHAFFKAVQALHYGRPEAYLKQLLAITTEQAVHACAGKAGLSSAPDAAT